MVRGAPLRPCGRDAKAQARRPGSPAGSHLPVGCRYRFSVGPGPRVRVTGCAADLTATEHALLRLLSLNAGRVLPYDMPLRRVWGPRQRGGPNLVRIFVRDLRCKPGEDAARPVLIVNQRGTGYRMSDQGER